MRFARGISSQTGEVLQVDGGPVPTVRGERDRRVIMGDPLEIAGGTT
jgi:hypothetical protein